MNSHPPRFARTLIAWLCQRDALVGDLDEEYRSGRTRGWYWRQALSAVVVSPVHQLVLAPLRAARGVVIGWAVFLALFALFDQTIGPPLSSVGYSTGYWLPFWIGAFLCSYTGFAASAWTVSRIEREKAGPVLMLHIASVVVAMAIAAAILELRARPTPVPHVLFPLVSVALPYQWRSGFVLAPLTMMLVGLLTSRRFWAAETR